MKIYSQNVFTTEIIIKPVSIHRSIKKKQKEYLFWNYNPKQILFVIIQLKYFPRQLVRQPSFANG